MNILIGNWKMNLQRSSAADLAHKIASFTVSLQRTEVWLTPTYTSLERVIEATQSSAVKVGSQNVHWEESGAFTGEISTAMIKELGCSFALAGHSERRSLFGDSEETSAKRAVRTITDGLVSVFCFGETLEERESGQTNKIIEKQLTPLLEKLQPGHVSSLVLAYEPVWAIGTGKSASTSEIEETHNFIKKFWQENAHTPSPPVLYGGSVAPNNFASILAIPSVSGAIVGGASLDADKFRDLIDISEGAENI